MYLPLGSVALVFLNLVFSTVALIVGLVVGWWIFAQKKDESPGQPSEPRNRTSASDRAIMAIGQIHDVAACVARDVDSHSSAVGKMSAELALLEGAGNSSGESAVGIIAKVLRANEKLQSQLAAAEAKLQAQAEEIASHQNAARTDSLTGLPNRRALDQEISRRFAEWQRKGTPFSVLMIDVDSFKEFNDTHGHQAGDDVLRQLGEGLKEFTREMDLPCRYGGEEFVVVMPATTIEAAGRAAERARMAIDMLTFRFGNESLKVTVSVGVAQVMPGDDSTGVLRRADEALYRAKHAGRNGSYFHDGSESRPVAPGPRSNPSPRPTPPAPEVRVLFTLPDGQYLEQELNRRTGESQRYGLPLSLMCLQVAQYPQLLGSHGQRAAHLVMDAVAQRLQATVREMDFLGYDGDGRFTVILPGSTATEAAQIARRIQTTASDQTVSIGDKSFGVSLQVGLASHQQGDDEISLRMRAEAELEQNAHVDENETVAV